MVYATQAKQKFSLTTKTLSSFMPDSLLNKIVTSPLLARFSNRIGKNCLIHPTAKIEGSIIGDNVEIGPYCYIRSSIIENNVTIREHSSVKISYLAQDSFTMPCDLFNVYLGEKSLIFTSILHNSFIGAESFIGGGSGFSDFNFEQNKIELAHCTEFAPHRFIGSAVGNQTKIGAGIIFKAGLCIPSKVSILNNEMIKQISSEEDIVYTKVKDKLISIPKQFITGKS